MSSARSDQGIANGHVVDGAGQGQAAIAIREVRAQLLGLMSALVDGRGCRGAGYRENDLAYRIFRPRGRLAALFGEFCADLISLASTPLFKACTRS